MTNRKPRKHTAFLWHRRAGLVAMVLVAILAITGILLNHTEEFGLDSSYVDSAMLMDWYGLEPENEPVSYRVDDLSITQWGDQVFFDHQLITEYDKAIRGAIKAEQFIVVAFERDVLLLSFDGELIERIPTGTSFAETLRLGMKYQR